MGERETPRNSLRAGLRSLPGSRGLGIIQARRVVQLGDTPGLAVGVGVLGTSTRGTGWTGQDIEYDFVEVAGSCTNSSGENCGSAGEGDNGNDVRRGVHNGEVSGQIMVLTWLGVVVATMAVAL